MDGCQGTGSGDGGDLAEGRGDDVRTAAARAAYLDAEARLFLVLAERDGSVGSGAGFRAGCGERLERLRLVHAEGPRRSGRWGVSARGRAFLEAAPPTASQRAAAWIRSGAAGAGAWTMGAAARVADRLHVAAQTALAALAVAAFWGLWCLAVAIDRIATRLGLDASREPV